MLLLKHIRRRINVILSLCYHRILNGDIENEIIHKLFSFFILLCVVVHIIMGMIINYHKSLLHARLFKYFKCTCLPVQACHHSIHEVPADVEDEMMKIPFAVDHDYSTCVASLAESHRH